MKSLIENELLGSIAIQEVLRSCDKHETSVACALLILPLLFNKKIRSILKHKRTTILSNKDLIMSYPSELSTVESLYHDLIITSLNSQIFSLETGVAALHNGKLKLKQIIYPEVNPKTYGTIASEISLAAPNVARLLQEGAIELYGNFRIRT